MAKLLLLLISLLSAAFEMETVTVNWPSGYSVDWLVRDETAHYSLTAKHYFSQKEKSYRWDIYGGANTFVLTLKDNKTSGLYYYFPITNDKAANVTNCFFLPTNATEKPIHHFLPNLSGMVHSENLTVNGLPAQKWIWKHNNSFFDLRVVDTVWLQMGDQTKGPIPIKAELKMNLESGINNFLEYDNYLAQEPDESVWSLPKNVKCQLANEGDADVIWDYVRHTLYPVGRFSFSNHFSDQKPLQRKITRSKGLKISGKLLESASPFPYTDEEVQLMSRQLPEVFDWRLHGAVTSVKNQGPCGSCWAFGIVGAMEGAYFRKTGFLGDMSVQALVDCSWGNYPSKDESVRGCFGGFLDVSLDWIKNHGGLPWAADYGHYKAINGRCTLNHVKHHGPIKGYVHVKADVDAVKVALYHHGPLAVAISTPFSFPFYTNGVIMPSIDPGPVDHCVLLVGYGSLNGEDYWLIKNSWGKGWGLSGFGLISTIDNALNLLNNVFYPELI